MEISGLGSCAMQISEIKSKWFYWSLNVDWRLKTEGFLERGTPMPRVSWHKMQQKIRMELLWLCSLEWLWNGSQGKNCFIIMSVIRGKAYWYSGNIKATMAFNVNVHCSCICGSLYIHTKTTSSAIEIKKKVKFSLSRTHTHTHS